MAMRVVVFSAILLSFVLVAPLSAEEPDALNGLVPVLRLFCAPCMDRYAQEYRPTSLWWEQRDGDGETIASSRRWERRREGSLAIPAPLEAAGGSSLVLLIEGSVFEPAHVYVLLDERWTNLAWYLGLPEDQALRQLSTFIRVEQAPPRVDPDRPYF